MKTYQTLSLIGCIIGILLMLFLSGIAGLGTIANDVSLNLTKQYGNSSELANRQKAHAASEELFSSFGAGTALSLFLFIAAIPITFVVKNTKAVGIILIILGIISIVITRGWGIIPFALLLPAGIVALREKKQVDNGVIKT
jgi:hypothetical protein